MGIAAPSEQRYRSLFDRHHREVYAYCRRRTDAQTAADCFAETFLVAWRRLGDVPDGDAALDAGDPLTGGGDRDLGVALDRRDQVGDLPARPVGALGERFDLKAFHRVVVGNGAVPLDVLERLVQDYVEAEKQGG